MNFAGNWELAGHVDVDSGTLMIVDPCYVDEGFDYDAWSPYGPLGTDNMDGRIPAPVQGSFAMSTLYGDGGWPVYIRKNAAGKVTAMMVDTDPQDDDADYGYWDDADEEYNNTRDDF